MVLFKSWKFCGVHFAPLLLPLDRRLQTLSVALWFMLAILIGSVTAIIFMYLILYTNYWWIPVLYLTWMIFDRKCQVRGGRPERVQKWARNWSLWRFYCNYFPIRLIRTVELDQTKNYIFGSHPHGLLCSGMFGAFATEGADVGKLFPNFKIHGTTLSLNFWFPLTREWILSLGGVSASKESISYLMKEPGGVIAVIVVGGAEESMFASQTQVSLVLNKRKGFIKIALQHGAQLVPTFSFGEAYIYNIRSTQPGTWIYTLQEKFKNMVGFAPVLFMGRGLFQYSFGLIPHRKPVNIVVGEPIQVKQVPNPSREDIEVLHAKYKEALLDLYSKYNPIYGDSSISLKIL
ncbi:2-acylglycerol O-acyltransferase 1 [Eurytemora carolleeae]|uniref:2-acylglycerol O-acyltransferase 1 n=1 Tax=Eurytemora carolleeae TaxID=1294199 RepID=UPI000C77CE13|nr:2-acylglycerol O-acyltransferase 1 [Eurytemora carolleeae]|eukprot:XP_023346005.1 2-acylglycerol O-acyltransferase 1-like [Eurytemora affinis]